MLHQFGKRLGAEVALRHPADHLDVAQAAGAFLDVGFELVRRVVVLVMPRALFAQFGLEVIAARPDVFGAGGGAHRVEQRRGAGQQARFHDVGGDGDVALRLVDALRDVAHAVTDFQADVPEQGQKTFDGLAPGLVIGAVEQDHQVDIGTGQQFAAAVTADGDQCNAADPARS